MPLMTLAKNRVFASTLGHVIRFVKDEPVNVPPIMVEQCENIGAVLLGSNVEIDSATEEEIISSVSASINAAKTAEGISTEVPKQPVEPINRMAAVLKAAEALIARNEREDFTAAGNIRLASISKETGFRVDKSELKQAMATINDPERTS